MTAIGWLGQVLLTFGLFQGAFAGPADTTAADTRAAGPAAGQLDTTNTCATRTIGQEFFTNLPARGVISAIALQPGVVIQGTNAAGEPAVHIRGGRSDEASYFLEGVPVTDVLFGGLGINIPAEAIEEIALQPDASSTAYGGGSSGTLQMQLRTGPAENWGGSLIAETDRFTPMNTRALGGYSYGYSDWTGTAGGPVPGTGEALRVFGFVQSTFYRDPTLSSRAGWGFSGANAVVTDSLITRYHPLSSRPDTLSLVFPGGNALGGQDNRWSVGGTALLDLKSIQIRLAGSYSYDRSREAATPENMFNLSRLPLTIERDGFLNFRFTHNLSKAVTYEIGFNYFARSYVSEDPELLGNLFAYGDPAANAALGYALRVTNGLSSNWPAYGLWGNAFSINQPGNQIAGYEKDSQKSIGGRAALMLHLGRHEVRFGGECTQYTVRRFAPADVFNWWNLRNQYSNPSVLELKLLLDPGTDLYGYDIWGYETDQDNTRSGSYYYLGPRKPVFAGAYLEDRIQFSDFTLDIGLRYDYIDPDSKDASVSAGLMHDYNGLLYASQFEQTSGTSQVSPRIGVSFPLGRSTFGHAQYCTFVQQSELSDSYAGPGRIDQLFCRGLFSTDLFGLGLKPVRTTSYEIGVSHLIDDIAFIDVTAFYKDIQDQVQVAIAGVEVDYLYPFYTLMNLGTTMSKGMEMVFELRRTHHVSVRAGYTYSDARGSGSTTTSNIGIYYNAILPLASGIGSPLDYNQTHRGSLQLDYRFGKDDGGDILERMGLNVLMTFNSGHNFTLLNEPVRGPAPDDPRYRMPVGPIGGSVTPWFFQLDARLDKAFTMGPMTLDVYVYVINLLGTENPVNVFLRTGDPSNDGWLQTDAGRLDAAQHGPQYVAFYNAVNDGKNSGNWGPPRQIRFGARIDL